MGNYSTSFNSLVDVHNTHTGELTWIKDKIADLENRSRRNNIKIRGMTESVPPQQLQQYALTLFSSMPPALSAQDLTIDKIHRLPKPSFLAAEIPRDVLLRVHCYHIKEIMATFRKAESLPKHYANIQLLPDLYKHMLQR